MGRLNPLAKNYDIIHLASKSDNDIYKIGQNWRGMTKS